MATWTNVANTSLEPGSPARSVDAFALRDNPIAIAEGAAGAPRIAGQTGPAVQTAGLFDSAVTTAKIANGNVTTAKIASNEQMTTANVLARTAGAGAGAVGSYAFCTTFTSLGPGSTISGSELRYSNADGGFIGSPTPVGTWRSMGRTVGGLSSDSERTTLFLRIS